MRTDQFPKPFWRGARNAWYVEVGGKQVKLAADKEEAFRLYHEMMARKPEERAEPIAAPSDLSVVEVIDRFLGWAKVNRAILTYEAYKQRLQALIDAIPASLSCSELKPYHLTRVMDAKEWGANRKSDFAGAVNRAFNWAMKQGLIDKNPVAHVEKPARQARELSITPKEYAEVMAKVAEPNFRVLLELAWETGARVQELRKIEARFFEPAENRIVFPPSESKGGRYHRVIYLGSDRSREIVAEQTRRYPSGPILRNSEGNAWTKDAINCAFVRLKQKIGRKLHLGAWRKGYATEAFKAGLAVQTLSQLLGHSNGVMLARVYAKVQQDPEYMAESARKAKRS
jgi:integrase